MNFFTFFKSVYFVLLIYFSFILNNSLSSVFTSDLLIASLITSLLLADLATSAYKLVFSNTPGLVFFLTSWIIASMGTFVFSFLSQNLIIIFALFFYTYSSMFLSRFSAIDDQIIQVFSSIDTIYKNFVIHEQRGILFTHYTVNYSNHLAFMSNADRNNFFELIKNLHGVISYNHDVSINFSLHKKGLRFFPSTKNELLYDINDIDNMLLNLLIEK